MASAGRLLVDIKVDQTTAAATPAEAIAFLVGRFGDDPLDASCPQQGSVGLRRVRLVTEDRIRTGPRRPAPARDTDNSSIRIGNTSESPDCPGPTNKTSDRPKWTDLTFRQIQGRKRKEGKSHIQALIALARRRINVIWAMLRDHTTYQEPVPTARSLVDNRIEIPSTQLANGPREDWPPMNSQHRLRQQFRHKLL
ncbi:hypothetical protein XU06_29770 (plasmid) [Rhodococcus erythropolis]|nr:hypothetical protein XU06_29770 [Rhodococcus erythropolis]